MIYAVGAAIGGVVYMKILSPRFSVRTLAAALISGATIQALFVFMVGEYSAYALNLVCGFAINGTTQRPRNCSQISCRPPPC